MPVEGIGPRATRQRILEAAAELFGAAATVNAVTVDVIAARAGVTKATLYHHFGSKETLLAAVREAGFDVAGLGHADRRGQILDAALQLFGQQGFHATSMDRIGEAAGVTKAAIYHYFRSKDDLVKALVERYSAILEAAQLNVADLGQDEEEALTHLASRLLETAQARIDVVRMAICESQRFPEVRDLVDREIMGRLLAFLSQYLEKRTEAGHLRAAKPLLVSHAFVSALVMFALAQQTFPDRFPFSDDEYARELVALFLNGLRQR